MFKSPGIICIESHPGNLDKIFKLFSYINYYFGDKGKLLQGSKIKINNNEILKKFHGESKIEYIKIDIPTGKIYTQENK